MVGAKNSADRVDPFTARQHRDAAGRAIAFSILGIIIYGSIYIGHMMWILVTQKIKGAPYTKHAYYDCIFERLARKAAGQLVDIPANQWSWGDKDLWPWW